MSEIVPLRIGFPRGLLYHKYAPLWTQFFRRLGCQVITSPETNRRILEKGTQYSIDENCLAVKVFIGHVEALIGKVDYVFIPHIVSVHKDERVCVKLFALGDIVRNTFENVRILEYTVDVEQHQYEWLGLIRAGLKVNPNLWRVVWAYTNARALFADKQKKQLRWQQEQIQKSARENTRILLVAHPYVIRDALLGKMIIRILQNQDVEIFMSDIVNEPTARLQSKNISQDLYWTYNIEQLGAVEIYRRAVDGIIFIMAFPCGPDALTIHLCQHRIEDTPICVLTMDELQSEAGLKTRLESFVDILRFKKEQGHDEKSSQFSASG